jgi:hypothetical protein
LPCAGAWPHAGQDRQKGVEIDLADGDGLSLDLIDEDRRRVERGGITAFEIDHDPGDVWAAGRS